ncbi:hypothetical protein OO012_16975 [Rhodobacteraceae bacterium KMM 6894]|nr:hypothetical protein [Rhodobacteraceae bacterium KMM 6894]
MFGIKIVTHAVRIVVNNWQDALRIGLMPMAICAATVGLMLNAMNVPLTIGLVGPKANMQPSMSEASGIFATSSIWAFCTLWIFVNWHRYVLLSEYPRRWMPPLHWRCIGAYLWKSVQIGLIAVTILAIAVLITMGLPMVGAAPFMVWAGLAVYGFFRVSPVLPSAAIGEKLGLSDAWEATRPGSGAIALVIVLLIVLDQIASLVGGAVLSINLALGLTVTAVLWAVTSLISVSVLTTIYGYYVQNRSLE